jgi:hypothetical protein
MSRFGWAYVNGMMTGTVANGPTNSIQINSGSGILFGSSNFIYNPSTNNVLLTGTLTTTSNIQGGGTLLITGATTLSGNTDIYAITQVRNSSLNMVSGSTIVSSLDQNGNMSGSGQLQIGTNITLGNNLTMNGPLFTSAGEIRVKNQTIKTTDAAGTTTKAYIDNNGDVSGSRNFFIGSDATIGNDAIINGTIRGAGGFKAGYISQTASYTVPKTAYFMAISGTTAVTASLQGATNYLAGQVLIFKDTSGNAAGAGRNIRISPSGSDQIEGAGPIVISNNFGARTLVCDGVSKFYIIASF